MVEDEDHKKESTLFSPLPQVRSERASSLLYIKNRLPEKPVETIAARGRFPSWLHREIHKGFSLKETVQEIKGSRLHTVCEEAKCPNILECYSKKTATFLLLGGACTRACGFCDIAHSTNLPPPDREEPARVALSAKSLGLSHVVLTMVARDDLSDGGALHVANTIAAIRKEIPEATCEVLVSDFLGNIDSLNIVLEAKPEIWNHNIETVERLSSRVRHTATYERSLFVLSYVQKNIHKRGRVKSGLMVGLGETEEELFQALRDLRKSGVDIVTIGQYLQASQKKLSVKEFVSPLQFEKYKKYGESIGILHVYSGPFVRSSYNAALFVEHAVDGTVRRIDEI